ncbi:hypothetical protein B0J17DRAFT_625888 [Rhizoctonia solani]|nr:hypothetical protein B0J17DRAFT_625888 [Rhizoctonia solani]
MPFRLGGTRAETIERMPGVFGLPQICAYIYPRKNPAIEIATQSVTGDVTFQSTAIAPPRHASSKVFPSLSRTWINGREKKIRPHIGACAGASLFGIFVVFMVRRRNIILKEYNMTKGNKQCK